MNKAAFLVVALCQPCLNAGTVRHNISAQLHPQEGRLTVADTLTFERPAAEFLFSLHTGLNPKVTLPGASIERVALAAPAAYDTNHSTAAPLLATFRVKLPKPRKTFSLEYSGVIAHPLDEQPQEYARSFAQTPGIISERGCYLSGSSGWHPAFENSLVTYRLETRLPAPYHSVSGGARTRHKQLNSHNISVWEEKNPQDNITLVCGKYHEYSLAGRPGLYAFMLSPDAELAGSYLEAAEQYTSLYSAFLGPYPYAKFALVENFWETGYGLPSYTLLGSKVMRLPFIIHSSFPHEILHNWWGNGVFVDYAQGNWCEGLSAYLADYLIAENRGTDRAYRAAALQKYAAYVESENDFALADFRGRDSSASEAVGYGKALMFYHMLRAAMGDHNFTAGLRHFYTANLYRSASFNDLRKSFETRTGAGRLSAFFSQWLERTGAPELSLKDVRINRDSDNYSLDFTLTQTQAAEPYTLKVPVLIYLEGVDQPRRKVLDVTRKEEIFNYSVPLKIQRLEIDPEFDVFRRLSPLETPPTLAGLLGTRNPAMVLPEGADLPAWKTFTAFWTKDPANLPLITLSTYVPPAPYWVLGAQNALTPAFEQRLTAFGARFTTHSVILDGREFSRAGHTFVLADYHPDNQQWTGALILARSTATLSALAAKLPHYGKYSWLVFDSGMNSAASGSWPPRRSPLTVNFTSADLSEKKPAPRRPLAALPSVFSKERMAADILALTALPGGRGAGTHGLRAAADYVENSLKKAGLKAFQPAAGELRNITAKVQGVKNPGEYVVLAAHYDHLAPGPLPYPGADDNASGIALLLELARYYAAHPRQRTLIFAAVDAEERGRLGSRAFLAGLNPGTQENINAALNFDTVGRLGEGQILILGAASSDKWQHIVRGAGFVTGADYALVPEALDAGDHISFIEHGIPAVQFFSGPNADYHKPTDTPEKIDYAGLVKQAQFAKEIINYLAGDSAFITRPAPSGVPAASAPERQTAASARKVATGLVPDFTYSGNGELAGVKAQDITPGSPLDKAGVKPGHIIVELNNQRITSLQDYSQTLKTLEPGAKITITAVNPDHLGVPAAKYSVEIELTPAR